MATPMLEYVNRAWIRSTQRSSSWVGVQVWQRGRVGGRGTLTGVKADVEGKGGEEAVGVGVGAEDMLSGGYRLGKGGRWK